MVKSLMFICYSALARSICEIKNQLTVLAPSQREILIKYIFAHDLCTKRTWFTIDTYIIKSCNIRHIIFDHCTQVNDTVLSTIGRETKNLITIIINGSKDISDLGLRELFRKQDCLEYIELDKNLHITWKGFGTLRCSKTLKTLKLRKLKLAKDEASLKEFLKNHTNIEKVKLISNDYINLDNIHITVELFAQFLNLSLKYLDVSDMHGLTDRTVEVLLQNCGNLQTFKVLGCRKLTGSSFTDLSLKCKNMHVLDLSYCHQFAVSVGLESLSHLSSSTIQTLSLCGVGIESETLLCNILNRLKNLRQVRLCGVDALNDKTLDQILEKQGDNLQLLDLSGALGNLTDVGLKSISRYCKNLDSLFLSYVRNITGYSLLPLFKDKKRAEKLKFLSICIQTLTEEVLYEIFSKCLNLIDLNCSGVSVLDDNLLSILSENCHNLTAIKLKGCKAITDFGFCTLITSNPNLKVVVAAGINKLTDKSIFCLANHCPYINELYLNGCSMISPHVVNYLLDVVIDRIYIEHKIPNAKPGQLMAKNLDTGEYCRADLLTLPNY